MRGMVPLRASVAVFLLLVSVGVAALVGRILAENSREDKLLSKFVGYSLLRISLPGSAVS